MNAVPFAFLLLAACAYAQDFRITSGVVDEQVFQRNSENRAEFRVGGVAPIGATVEARLLLRNSAAAFDWKPIAKAQGQVWSGEIRGIPVGGPYRLELRIPGTTIAVADLLVGDLWVLAGQSNMEGYGDLIEVEPRHELVHSFDQTDHWLVAEEPLHRLVDAADRVHWRRNSQKQPEKLEGEQLQQFLQNRAKGASPGLTFAVEIVRRTGVPVGLIPCAHGGTSMNQWDPALRDHGGDSLYGAMVRRVRAVGGKVAGVLWYQGESDALDLKAAPLFQEKFERFVKAVREDFNQASLPFYYVQIGRLCNSIAAEWNLVQEMQRRAELAISNSAMVPAVDLGLDDTIHIGTPDQKRLGRRLANLARGQLKKGPRPISAKFDNGIVRVRSSDVNGGLRGTGDRIAGFSLHAPNDELIPRIYRVRVDPEHRSTVLLYTRTKPLTNFVEIGGQLPEGTTLRYGYGKDPYCNLTDDADMGVPVFGPLAIQ